MNKTKIIPLLICICFLCSCSIRNNNSSSNPDMISIDSSIEIIMSENSNINNYDSFNVTENGVEFFRGSEIVQIIEGQFLEELSIYLPERSPESFLIFEDYDFDGYNDLFIPSLIGRPNIPGVYYRFNPETSLFEEWDEMKQIGLSVSVDREKSELKSSSVSSAIDHKSLTYKWNNDKLVLTERQVQYMDPNEQQIYIDTFEYDGNENEKLIKREKAILDDNKNWLGTEEIGIIFPENQFEFSVNSIMNTVDVMLDGNVIQSLECDYPPYCGENAEDKLIFEDYDFNGIKDLFIPIANGAMYSQGTYYRFNQNSQRFEKWDELNEIGRQMIIKDSYLKLRNYDSPYWLNYYNYHWILGHLIPFEHEISPDGKTVEVYSIDQNNIETLLRTYTIDTNNDNSEQPDFQFTVNSTSLTIKQGDKIMQTIDGDFSYLASSPDLVKHFFRDYNFDGYKDLWLETVPDPYNSSGIFYRYNQTNKLFEQWDELNDLGIGWLRINENGTLSGSIKHGDQYYSEMFTYKWDNEKPVLIAHVISYFDENNDYWFESYSVDINGNETLVSKEKSYQTPAY